MRDCEYLLDIERGSIMAGTKCEYCANYVYDEDYEYYVCDMDLDEDDMVRFLTGNTNSCPYYQLYDEYKIVRHQM